MPDLPDSGEAKIADLEVAVGVDEDVGGLEVTMEDVCRVDILQASQYLINTENTTVRHRDRLDERLARR